MRSYFRVMLGRRSVFAEQCFAGDFIGVDYSIAEDLSQKLPEEWRVFNRQFIPVFLAGHPDKTRISAGLACGALWTVTKGIRKGDIVLCPDGAGAYRVGEVISDYQYVPGPVLPHRRPVQWLPQSIDRSSMSDGLRNSTGAPGTVSDISAHRDEIEKLIGAGNRENVADMREAPHIRAPGSMARHAGMRLPTRICSGPGATRRTADEAHHTARVTARVAARVGRGVDPRGRVDKQTLQHVVELGGRYPGNYPGNYPRPEPARGCGWSLPHAAAPAVDARGCL